MAIRAASMDVVTARFAATAGCFRPIGGGSEGIAESNYYLRPIPKIRITNFLL